MFQPSPESLDARLDELPEETDFINTAAAIADLGDGQGRRRLDEIFAEANGEIEAARLIEAAIAALADDTLSLKDQET